MPACCSCSAFFTSSFLAGETADASFLAGAVGDAPWALAGLAATDSAKMTSAPTRYGFDCMGFLFLSWRHRSGGRNELSGVRGPSLVGSRDRASHAIDSADATWAPFGHHQRNTAAICG